MPPLYGQWHAITSQIKNDSVDWMKDVNLDPRSRVAASIGAEIVKRNQEELMAGAWEQVDNILSAVQKISIAEVATRVGQVAFEKHIKHPKENAEEVAVKSRVLSMTYTLSDQVRLNSEEALTIKNHINESKVPSPIFSNGFKKIVRPGLMRSEFLGAQGGGEFSKGIVNRYRVETENSLQRSLAIKKIMFPSDATPTVELRLAIEEVEAAMMTNSQINPESLQEENTFSTRLSELESILTSNQFASPLFELQEGVETTLEQRTSPKLVIQEKLAGIIQVKNLNSNEYVDFNVEFWNSETNSFTALSDSYSLASSISNTVLPYPEFDMPIYELLKDVSPDYIIPNIHQLPDNSATILEPNPRFIEALFVGLNHEFGRELLWREYPTDQRGSYFRKFWDRSDADDSEVNDIDVPLHEWNNALGANTNIGGDYLILVIRGELLRKFPNTLFFAQEAAFVEPIPTTAAQMENAPRIPKAGGTTVYPKFTAQLEQDVTLVAFEMTKETALGKNNAGVNVNAGYFFCLQERPGEMRFGLSGVERDTFFSWLELNWIELSSPKVLKSNLALPIIQDTNGVSWFESSASQSFILLRQPTNFIVQSKDLIYEAN